MQVSATQDLQTTSPSFQWEVVHAIQGRVRLRAKAPQLFTKLAEAFERFLRSQPGIRDVSLTPSCHSVVLTYDHDRCTLETLLARMWALSPDQLQTYPLHPAAGDALYADTLWWLPFGLSSAAVAAGILTETALAPWFLIGAALPIFTRAYDTLTQKSVLTRAAAQEITITDEHLLERLATVDVIVFEKTGAFTRGTPEITDVLPYGKKITAGHVLAYAAAAEKHLPHPLANALVQAAERKGINLPERDAVEHRIGLGVESTVEGATVLVGSQRFLTQKGVRLQRTRKDVRAIRTQTGQIVSPLFVARDGKLIGLLIFTDPLRPEADVAISTLRAEGKQEIVLLTGDHPDTAEQVAKQLGISRTLADAIPEQKAEFIRLLQQGGHTVAVVGDGITTSPILAHADVGIIIRGGGENLQNGVSGALVECDLRQLPQTISLAQESVDLRRQNSNLIFYTNAVAAALALPGLISLNVASVLSLGSVFLATVNALRPLGNSAVLSSASRSLSFALRHASKHETKHGEKKSRSEC